jgi:shikimate dehydrogenase
VNHPPKLAGVIGWPIGHSLSPRIHNHWLKSLGIDGAYVALPVKREDFSRAIEGLRRAGFVGLNVTLPHKQAAFAIADALDDAAQATGAVNLLLFGGGGRIGRNTDVEGLRLSLLEEFGPQVVAGRKAVVLGAGGAARAAAMALDQLGATEIRIVNRNTARVAGCAAALRPHLGASLIPIPWGEWLEASTDAALLVNAASGGMRGASDLDVSLAELPAGAAVYDLVYNPCETGLLKRAQALGHRTAGGLGMLLQQAVPSFAALYGTTPTITPELRSELEQALSS